MPSLNTRLPNWLEGPHGVPHRWFLGLVAFVAATVAPLAAFGQAPSSDPSALAPLVVARADSAFEDLAAVPGIAELSELVVTTGTITRGDSVYLSLTDQGITPRTVYEISNALEGVFDFRNALPGHWYRLVQRTDGTILEFFYGTSALEGYRLYRDGGDFVAERHEVEMIRRVSRIAGVIQSTLYESVEALGESSLLAGDFAQLFAWDVDFSRSVRKGDEFSVLYERLYRKDALGKETYVRPGRILAARYTGGSGSHTAVYFEQKDGRGGYFRPDGSSMERQFMMAPLKYNRISSSYTLKRRHPILKVTRPHQGIDYAAPVGTPVWSVANGKVLYKGWAGGFGRLVKIKHDDGYVSYYGHLSKYAKNLEVGQRIQQQEVLGYVGKSGLATGPHVCFRIAKNGSYVNPTRLRTPPADPVPPQFENAFHSIRDRRLAQLDPTREVGLAEAL